MGEEGREVTTITNSFQGVLLTVSTSILAASLRIPRIHRYATSYSPHRTSMGEEGREVTTERNSFRDQA